MNEPEVRYIQVTPKKANQYLAEAYPNRAVDENLVNYYSWIMRSGQWVATRGIPLRFYDGRLGAGQHRLKAVVKADRMVIFPARFYPSIREVREAAERECRKYFQPE